MSSKNLDLKEFGFKITQPRLEILKLFEENKDKHLSPDDVFSKLKSQGSSIGIATVYRVLGQFETSGIINRLKFDNEQVMYELNQGDHHDHIICIKCNKIQEFYSEEIEKFQKQIVESLGAEIIDHNLNIYVKCKSCRGK
ncbi:transcriptional repressor [Allofrancisella guangzhouensis]|uniref:Ferric uptake regulation protein n=1 Tax=Allofrancisella guangzhouensis TaxID=594679 RepID=A0A0A8E8M5_9GAMM|nr:Fur family transcriptional regulator [Allofrancisella guangzhouensis]AJC48491.1 Fur family transcriptional regulator [Allofrancisella guangzhouensis]MBK2027604.1 transcriptional repressor [Allofrancisella guangzhouensis]MBK2044083.1 transcriptional repressor [Allofrancisella guangzhouensis]MBK2046531.1 transcriptional repressor [Allofrancisella guangzhouensis]